MKVRSSVKKMCSDCKIHMLIAR
ncbi:50S ribosomal protein L36 [Desulfobulbus sp. N2]|nr:50S ribosomal protein L36 [Desulfobulbus sp. N2]